jgi:ribonucleoside-diphosphate reductase subunit M1
LGTIKSSNLCCEIVEFSSKEETAVCNLASIGLPSFVKNNVFDYEHLHKVVKLLVTNLDNIIDINFYPTAEAKTSNLRHRPIGIGVQGLADTFVLLDLAFESEEARETNKLIFETMYHAALEASCELATTRGPYSTFFKTETKDGCPASQGILQYDMWLNEPTNRYDWATLKADIIKHGLRNSQLIALMPTATTSQMLGFNECFEPFTSNIYTRGTLAGEFIVINKYLIREMIASNQWSEDIKNNIIANKGSVQQLTQLSPHTRNKFKTVWEISMKTVIDMAADRAPFICQSQSMNLWMEDPEYGKLTSMHFYAWRKGLKTGCYYLRRKARHQAQQFTVEPVGPVAREATQESVCEMCSA